MMQLRKRSNSSQNVQPSKLDDVEYGRPRARTSTDGDEITVTQNLNKRDAVMFRVAGIAAFILVFLMFSLIYRKLGSSDPCQVMRTSFLVSYKPVMFVKLTAMYRKSTCVSPVQQRYQKYYPRSFINSGKTLMFQAASFLSGMRSGSNFFQVNEATRSRFYSFKSLNIHTSFGQTSQGET